MRKWTNTIVKTKYYQLQFEKQAESNSEEQKDSSQLTLSKNQDESSNPENESKVKNIEEAKSSNGDCGEIEKQSTTTRGSGLDPTGKSRENEGEENDEEESLQPNGESEAQKAEEAKETK